MAQRSLGHRAPLLWLVLPLMAGLAAGRAGLLPANAWGLVPAGLAAGLALVAGWRDWPRTWAATLGAAMVLAGAALYARVQPRPAKGWDALPPREAEATLTVERVFPRTDPRRAAGIARIDGTESPVRGLDGQRAHYALTLVPGTEAPIVGAVFRARGVVAVLPRNPPPNSFESYLAGAGVGFRLTRGRWLGEVRAAPAYRRFCARALARCGELLGAGVAAKQPALTHVLRAMLLGQQQELSPEQLARYRQSGTMHVFSISGLHIAVIAAGLGAVLALLRLPRLLRTGLGLAALWLYVDLTGTAPSAVRAFVMVAFAQVALALRAPRNPLAALTVSALVVLLAAPLDLFSASFQMSYGIVAALLLLGLPLAERWLEATALFTALPRPAWRWHQRLRDATWRALVAAVGLGLASSLVGAVTGLAFFSMLTPGALLANLWLIPASSLVILFGLVSLLAGLAGWAGAGVLANHAAVLVLWVIDRVLQLNLRLPGMWFTAEFRVPGLGGVALALLLASLLAGYASRWEGWCRGFWPPFAVVALTLMFGVRFG